MTLADIAAMDKAWLLPREVASVLSTSDQSIRVCARQRPDLLGFPTVIMGSRVRIPRIPFLEFMGYQPGKENDHEKPHTPEVDG